MFGIGFLELCVIAAAGLLCIGPQKMPEVMRQLGRLFVHLRRVSSEVHATFDDVVRDAERDIRREEAARKMPPSLQPSQDQHPHAPDPPQKL